MSLAVATALAQSGPPTVGFEKSSDTVKEADGSLLVKVVLSAVSTETVTVQYATQNGAAVAPDDYASANGTLTFGPGITAAFITIQVVDDGIAEGAETATVTLSNPQNATLGTQLFTFTIEDGGGFPVPDPPVQFGSFTYTASEGAGAATIDVILSWPSTKTVTVAYATATDSGPHPATAGEDYTAASGTLTFAPGETSKTFTVTILQDEIYEGDERIALALSSPTNAVLGGCITATLTITDDDPPPPAVSLVSQKTAICAGGKSSAPHQTTMTAQLIDPISLMPLMQSGVEISFATTAGALDAASAMTDAFGQAVVTLTSSDTASEPPAFFVATVTAAVGFNSASVDVEFQTTSIILTVSPTALYLGQSADLLATLTWNGLPISQHTLGWRISRIWDENDELVYDGAGPPPTDYGSIAADSAIETDINGQGAAIYSAGTLPGTIELEVADNDVKWVTTGKHPTATLTVTQEPGPKIKKVEWVGYVHNDGETNHLADAPEMKDMGGGDILYAERNNPQGWEGKDDIHNKIKVKVTLDKAPKEGMPLKVYLRIFDPAIYDAKKVVTGKSANIGIIAFGVLVVSDLGASFEDSGTPTTSITINASETSAETVMVVDIQFIQPTNNFVAAGHQDKKYLAGLTLASDGRTLIDDKQNKLDGALQTPILTLWRTLYVERQTMGAPIYTQGTAPSKIASGKVTLKNEFPMDVYIDFNFKAGTYNQYQDGYISLYNKDGTFVGSVCRKKPGFTISYRSGS